MLGLFQTVCVDMSMVDGVAGELTFDKMYMFQMNYRWITRQSTSSDENTLKPTVGSIINISDDEKDFEIQIQSEPYVSPLSSAVRFRQEKKLTGLRLVIQCQSR